ncbi:MAG: hypothetical protein U9R39_10895 [Campylobacterota bacterium]|nr:hypothetical protein [Campylobacterota bacterium]
MLNKLFGKEIYTTQSFLEELYKYDFDEKFLDDAISSKKVDINHQDKDGNSFLHLCLFKSKFKSALWLIKNNANVELFNNIKESPINIIIEKNNHQLLKTILSVSDIDINKKDDFGRNLLQDTVVLGYNDMAKILIENGADVNSVDKNGRNVIFDALSYGNDSFLEYMLSLDNIELNNMDINENSIMHHSEVIKDDSKALKLIEAGADVTLQNKDGETYLCNTALRGMDGYPLVSSAIKQGADINSRVANENTILMELIATTVKLSDDEKERRKNLFEMSKKVLLHGIDTNAIDENNETALFRAVRVLDQELVAFLLSAGVNPNIQNNRLQTVLNYTAYQGVNSIDTLILLLKYKANAILKDENNQTLYEILNNIILHTHNKKVMTNKYILSLITKEGQYMLVLKELLEHNKEDLNFLDSTGSPLFFEPLLNDHFPLFKLYIKNGLNIQSLNILHHNVFFEYVLKVFEDDNTDIEFQNNISMLISSKLDHNYQDDTGHAIVHKILGTNCNLSLFDILTQVVLFDYNITDNLGRSVIHTAVWHDKTRVIRRLHLINQNIVNIPDNYGILPITYAALLGSQKLVLLFIELGANVKSGLTIPDPAIKQFSPMLKNLDKLKEHIEGKDIIEKMKIVIDQVKRDFKVI